jgi:hypothetical protein
MRPTGKEKKYGKVPIARIKSDLNEIPEDCGYMQRFHYNIDMNSNGIMGECIEWCQIHCKGKWGWWFENANQMENPNNHWEDPNSYMSFQYKKDATRFWLAIGIQNMGNREA